MTLLPTTAIDALLLQSADTYLQEMRASLPVPCLRRHRATLIISVLPCPTQCCRKLDYSDHDGYEYSDASFLKKLKEIDKALGP